MKNIIITILLACLFGNIQQAQAQAGAPLEGGYVLWYEYGNGSFINTSFGATADLQDYLANTLPANNGGTGPLLGKVKVTTVYKPTPPPPPSLKLFAYQPTDAVNTSSVTTPIPAGKTLHLHTSTNDFLSNDTMMLAINYTKPANAVKLAIFYNSNPNAIFNPIANANSTTYYPNTETDDSLAIPNIRMYNGEVASIPSSLMFNTGNPGEGYQNGIVFTINSSTTNNIFLTLFTYPTIVTTANEKIKLVFLDGTNKAINKGDVSNIVNNSKLKSHDPNNEITNPECLEIGKIPDNKIIRYHVNFQNIGLGQADSVKTTTVLPVGYTVADVMTNNSNLIWNIADIPRNALYTAQIIPTANTNALYIEFRKVTAPYVLRGTQGIPNPLSDVRTMGGFDFDLKLHNGISTPMNLASYTSIVFDDNEPVLTDSATIRIRKCCTCREKGDEQNDVLNNKNCCRNPKLKKWQQWLFCKDCD
jgi:hypothetical protein